MKQLLFILLTFVHLTTLGQSNIKVGQKAPQITITDWISNIPNNKTLTGKYIVLEFWATWCGPCIAAVPHMNNLQAKFNNPNLYFISITDESKEKVERILKRIEFKSIVVSDQNKKTQVLFGDGKKGLEVFPLTILIDNKGFISWIGEPHELSELIIIDFIKGKKYNKNEIKLDSSSKEPIKSESGVDKDNFMELITNKDILYKLEFKKSKSENQQMSKGGQGLFSYTATSFIDIYSDLFGQTKSNISMPDTLKNEKFDLIYKNLKGDNQSLVEIESHILKTVGLKKSKLTEKFVVNEVSISIPQLLEKALYEKFSAKSDANDKIIFTSFTINDLIKELNTYSTERFSVGKTIEGKFDFIIEIKSAENIIKSLVSYGFKITNVEKEIEIWELTKEK